MGINPKRIAILNKLDNIDLAATLFQFANNRVVSADDGSNVTKCKAFLLPFAFEPGAQFFVLGRVGGGFHCLDGRDNVECREIRDYYWQ